VISAIASAEARPRVNTRVEEPAATSVDSRSAASDSADFFVGFYPTTPPGASTSGGFHSATIRRPCGAVERLTTPTWPGSTPRNVATVAPGVTKDADATITCG